MIYRLLFSVFFFSSFVYASDSLMFSVSSQPASYQPIHQVVFSSLIQYRFSLFEVVNDTPLSDSKKVSVIGGVLPYPSPMSWEIGGVIGYRLSKSADIDLRIFDMRGIEVASLFFQNETIGGREGYNKIPFDRSSVGYDLHTGVFTIVLLAEGDVIGKTKVGVIR
jgi:hypothetical protein